jgi:hypothetical protein
MVKKLSAKQKKIASMAGDPNKIDGADFKAMKKANKGMAVQMGGAHKRYKMSGKV